MPLSVIDVDIDANGPLTPTPPSRHGADTCEFALMREEAGDMTGVCLFTSASYLAEKLSFVVSIPLNRIDDVIRFLLRGIVPGRRGRSCRDHAGRPYQRRRCVTEVTSAGRRSNVTRAGAGRGGRYVRAVPNVGRRGYILDVILASRRRLPGGRVNEGGGARGGACFLVVSTSCATVLVWRVKGAARMGRVRGQFYVQGQRGRAVLSAPLADQALQGRGALGETLARPIADGPATTS